MILAALFIRSSLQLIYFNSVQDGQRSHYTRAASWLGLNTLLVCINNTSRQPLLDDSGASRLVSELSFFMRLLKGRVLSDFLG